MSDSHGDTQNMESGSKQSPSICSNGMASCGLQSSDRYSLEGWRFSNRSDSNKSYDSDVFLHNWGIPDQLGDKYVIICGKSSTETESKAERYFQLSMSSYEGKSYSRSYESYYTDDSSIRSGIASTEVSSSSESDGSFSPIKLMEAMQALWRDNPPMSYTTSDSQSLTDRIGELSPADQLALIGMLEMDTIPSSSDDDETVDSKCGDAIDCGNRLHWVLNNQFFAVDECNEKMIDMVEAAKENASNEPIKMNWLVPFVASAHSSFHESYSFDEDDRCSTSTDAQGNHLPRNGTSVTWWDTKDCKVQAKNQMSDSMNSMSEIMDQVEEANQSDEVGDTARDRFEKVHVSLGTSDDDVNTPGNKQDRLVTKAKYENSEGHDRIQDIVEIHNGPKMGGEMERNTEYTRDPSDTNVGDENEPDYNSAQVQDILKINTDESVELNQDSFFTSMEGSLNQVRNASSTSEEGLSFETEEDVGFSHTLETDTEDEDDLVDGFDQSPSTSGTSDGNIGTFLLADSEEGEDEFKGSSDQTHTILDSSEGDEHSFTTEESLEEVLQADTLDCNSGGANESEESLDPIQDTRSYQIERNTEDDLSDLDEKVCDKDGYDTENSLLDHTHECLDHSLLGNTKGALTNVEVKENEQDREAALEREGNYQVLVNDLKRITDDEMRSSQQSPGKRVSHGHPSLLKAPKHAEPTFGIFDFFTPLLTLCNRKKERKASASKNMNNEMDPDEKDSRTITLLYSAIRNHDTEGALACLNRFPEECRTWVTCCDTISNERKLISSPQRLKYLPLHTACLSRSPLHLVKEIMRTYPDAIRKRAGNYKYPIHMACDAGVDTDVMCCLIQAWPESIYALDGDNNIPLCALLLNKPLSPDQDAIMMILLASFQELQELEAESTKRM